MFKKKFYTGLLFLALVQLSMASVAAQSRGVGVKIKSNDGQTKEVKLYEGSYALVIGESKYTNGWDPLPGVSSDVIAVRQILESRGFKVETAENVNSRDFEARIKQFIDDYGYQANNRILIYYAGHGHTLKSSGDGRELGYVVPVDAPNPAGDETEFRRKAISMDKIQTFAKEIQSKHAMFIFDSCFSGKLVSRNSIVIPPIIEESVAFPVRQFITAGAANQPVPDESIFRRSFVRGLEGEADRNRDGYITGTELADFLKEKVTNYSNRAQTPQYGKINDIELDKGDFVFPLSGAMAPVSSATNAPVMNEPPVSAGDPISLANQSLTQIKLGNYTRAQELSNRALQINSNLALALAVSGWVKTRNGDMPGARIDLEKAVQIEPANSLARSRLANVYNILNEKDLAESNANQVLEQLVSPKTDLEYFTKGNVNIYLKKSDEAIADLSKAIELNPDFAAAYHNRGLLYQGKKQDDQAISDLTKAIEINPNFSTAYLNRGITYRNKQLYDQAIADLTKVIELDPKFSDAYFNRGNTYAAKRQYDQAIADYTIVIELNPNISNAFYNRGIAYRTRQLYDQAISDLTKAIELDPKYTAAYGSRGIAYFEKRQYDQAIADYTKSIELDPRSKSVYHNRAVAYYNKQSFDQAIADYTKVIELDPKYANAYYGRGVTYNSKQFFNQAIADYTKAIELDPKFTIAYDSRAFSYKQIGREDLAAADRLKYKELGGQ